MDVQSPRLIIVALQGGPVKIYVASCDSGDAKEKWKRGWNSVQKSHFLHCFIFILFYVAT